MDTPQDAASDLQDDTPETAVWNARASLAVLFLAVVAGWSLLNLYTQGPRIADGLSGAATPDSYRAVRALFKKGGTLVDENVLGKPEAWDMHARIEASLGKSAMNNMAVIKGPDGRLFRGGLYSIPVNNAAALAVDVAALAEAAGERDIGILCLGTPDTVVKGAGNLPDGMPYLDYNAAVDAFLFTLRERGVPFLDSRHDFAASRMPPGGIISKTGFLLTGEAAFFLFTRLVDVLEDRFSLRLDPERFYRDRANYTVTDYPRFFMGQLGKETGSAFAGLDDFAAFSPAFDTEFHIEGVDMFGNAIAATGDAEDTLLNPDAFVYYDNLYNLYPEGYYVHTNAAWSRIVNPRNPAGPKLLVVHDFYTAQLIGHLAPMCSEIHTMTYRENYSINALDYIRDKDFDCIVVAFFPQNLLLPQSRVLVLGEEGMRTE